MTMNDKDLSREEIMDMCPDAKHDPMPYHKIINLEGKIFSGKKNSEQCDHIGRESASALSYAYVGGIDADTGEVTNTMTDAQRETLTYLLRCDKARHPEWTIHGANEFIPTTSPNFDVQEFLKSINLSNPENK